MKTENVNELIALFNGEGVDKETGNSIFENIDSAYNVYGSFPKISKSIYDELTAEGKKRFYTIWAVAGLELAYEWVRSGYKCFDARKEASEIFAYNNLCEIENLFQAHTNISVNLLGEEKEKLEKSWFPDWLHFQIYSQLEREGLKENAWILAFVSKFASMHSTLKQSYFGGVVNGVLISENPTHDFNSNSPNGGIVFPFI